MSMSLTGGMGISEGQPRGREKMALGYMMFSMPTALIGSCYLCAMNGFGAAQGLAVYALFGTLFLIGASIYRGVEQR